MYTDDQFNNIFEKAKQYSKEHFGDFNVNSIISFRNRKRNVVRRSGKLCVDEPIENPEQYFEISIFF